jgi:hypothetical protein
MWMGLLGTFLLASSVGALALTPAAPAAGAAGRPVTPTEHVVATGYDLVGADGGVFVFGGGFYGSLPELGIHVTDIVGIVASADYRGYFLVGSDGGVFSFGDTTFEGSLPGIGVHPNQPIVGIVPTSDDHGYFLVGADGGVFAFGDAQYEGSLPGLGQHVADVSSIASTPDNHGYWVLEKEGQVTNFGTAPNLVSTSPALGTYGPKFYYTCITATTTGQGYWVLDNWGGVWGFGDGRVFGIALTQANFGNGELPVSLVGTSDNGGYWIVMSNGDVVAIGDAGAFGTLPSIGVHPNLPIVGAVPT